MQKPNLLLIAAAVLALFVTPLYASAAEKTESLILTAGELEASGADELELSLLLGGAEVTIRQSDSTDYIVQAVVTYDTDGPAPYLKTSDSDADFEAIFSSGYERDYDYGCDDYPYIQTWVITIGSYDVDTDLFVAGGGISGDMDFGGMPLKEANLAMGGVEINVDFSTPTSRSVERFSIEGGGLTLEISNIGNTDFQQFDLIGGGFMADLDFSGDYSSGEHEVNIIGAGNTLDISVPDDAGETIDVLAVAAAVSVKGSGWQTSRNLFFFKDYETADYGSQDVRIKMELIAVGSVVGIERN